MFYIGAHQRMRICIYIYINNHIHICIHTTYLCKCVCIYICVCVCSYLVSILIYICIPYTYICILYVKKHAVCNTRKLRYPNRFPKYHGPSMLTPSMAFRFSIANCGPSGTSIFHSMVVGIILIPLLFHISHIKSP